jgi:hypothetical protein
MTKDKARLGAGDVQIRLNGEEKTLRPTLSAAIVISRMSGGILGAMQRVSQLDFDTMVVVTRAGLDLTDLGAKGLEEKVFASGLGYADGLAKPLTLYLENLANGGRPRVVEGSTDDAERPPLDNA